MTHFFFWTSRSQVLRHVCVRVARKKNKNWLRRANIKSKIRPKIEYILKPSNYDAKPWVSHLTAQKSKFPRRFWELDLEISRTCLMCPCRAFYYECFFLSFFPPKMWGTKHACKISGSNSQKRRGHWQLKEFWVLCLNQPVWGDRVETQSIPLQVCLLC